MQKKEQHISSNYTTHCWLPDHKILVGTDQGDILICENDGSFKLVLHQENPVEGFYISCIRTYMRGFIVGGNNGQVLVYEKSDDPKNPYVRVARLPLDQPDNKSGDSKNKPHVMSALRDSRI